MKQIGSTLELQDFIGYTFRDPGILRKALTRRAYQNENPETGDSMDPLATRGEAVLAVIVLSRLYEAGVKDKGKPTDLKSRKVRREKNTGVCQKTPLTGICRRGKRGT